MRTRQCALVATSVIGSLGTLGCHAPVESAQALTPVSRAAVETNVQLFMTAVAHDVTSEGPMAWQRYFADGPEFFMAVNGQLAFPNGQAAA